MGARYSQLDLEERCAVARLQVEGRSVRQIAAALDRAPSTIARELNRNAGRDGYRPGYGQEQARARRWRGSRLERDAGLRERVLSELARGLSPQQVSGRLAREAGRAVISHESIYRFIYAQISRAKPSPQGGWRHYLPRAKAKRGWRGRKGGSSVDHIQLRRPLSERPAAAADRRQAGHWEADLMLFGRSGPALLMLHERHSRLLLALPVASKAAAPIARLLVALLRGWPPALRRTVSFDNGNEFAQHRALHRLGVETFFCDAYAPWQKAGSRTRSAACAGSCRAASSSPNSASNGSCRCCSCTTTPRASASTTSPRPKSSASNWRTCNVNPPSCLRRNDGHGANSAD